MATTHSTAKRRALVISCSRYSDKNPGVNDLDECKGDAAMVHDHLIDCSIWGECERLEDPNQVQFDSALSKLLRRPLGGHMCFLYFAGHCYTSNGFHYLQLADRDSDPCVEGILASTNEHFVFVAVVHGCRDMNLIGARPSEPPAPGHYLRKLNRDYLCFFACLLGEGCPDRSDFAKVLSNLLVTPGLTLNDMNSRLKRGMRSHRVEAIDSISALYYARPPLRDHLPSYMPRLALIVLCAPFVLSLLLWIAFNRGAFDSMAGRASHIHHTFASALEAWALSQFILRLTECVCLTLIFFGMLLVYPLVWRVRSHLWSDSDVLVWLSWGAVGALFRLILSSAELKTQVAGSYLLSPETYSKVKACGDVSFQISFICLAAWWCNTLQLTSFESYHWCLLNTSAVSFLAYWLSMPEFDSQDVLYTSAIMQGLAVKLFCLCLSGLARKRALPLRSTPMLLDGETFWIFIIQSVWAVQSLSFDCLPVEWLARCPVAFVATCKFCEIANLFLTLRAAAKSAVQDERAPVCTAIKKALVLCTDRFNCCLARSALGDQAWFYEALTSGH